ncbi:DUF1697 domain-containing protein [Nocardioides zeae]|uniref:DUF1697 domain-containing protein n=1 Tax=Nocardioides imazamoxiresistens TaxID=3231893 RepID=A0ABU3PQM8_9ACTN|nr:DUF1697 domain-containing protein [Nocardioides zeae]MDT9591530.1 DUF1697 domain-containing protein [Nocardioides zeae]
MATYVAFLRAINLGARNKFPMPELRALLEADGFADVRTHINTGNVHLVSRMRSTVRVAARLEELFAADRGFAVPTVVMTPAEVAAIAARTETWGAELAAEQAADPAVPAVAGQYVSLLRDLPPPDGVAALEAYVDGLAGAARVHVDGRAVHLALTEGYQSARVDHNRIERLLGTTGTNRNVTVVRRVARDWC